MPRLAHQSRDRARLQVRRALHECAPVSNGVGPRYVSVLPVLIHVRYCAARAVSIPVIKKERVYSVEFNENEPVVCRPEEALDCFLRTKMDLLILGNHVVRRTTTAAP
jgi:Carbamoyltransferase C-terminus